MILLSNGLDTTPEVEKIRLQLLAKLSPQERFERMNRLCVFGKLAMLEGIREKNPELSEKELMLLLARNLWGIEFAKHIEKNYT